MMNKIAVYGTLRKGCGNYTWLLNGKEPLVTERLKGFKMYSIGGFPGIKHSDESEITIEVFEVNDDELSRVNRLEGYVPESDKNGFYDRGIVITSVGDAYIYIYQPPVSEKYLIKSGDWIEYIKQRHKTREENKAVTA